MKLGELFVYIKTKGNTDKLDEAQRKLEKAQKTTEKGIKQSKKEVKTNNEVAKSINGVANVVKSLSGGLKGSGGAISALGAFGGAASDTVMAVGALVTGVALAYSAIDRMITSLAQANQQMITFQRTSGISLQSLNKYATANAAVNANSSIEGTAQSMQRLANNLWNIQMGRGDISPYQELAFVGGKAFNPVGMSVEQVIENVREAIKGVDDLQATNIIQRMGFAPDDLLMLRMSREEFEKLNDLFLSPQKREEMYKYGLELKKIHLEFQKVGQSITINLAKPFITTITVVKKLSEFIYKAIIKPIQLGFKTIGSLISNSVSLVKALTKAFLETFEILKPIFSLVKALTKAFLETFEILKPIFSILKMIGEAIWLPIEDVLTYLTGGDSLTGRALEGLSNIIDNLNASFEDSKIVKFFESIKKGITDLTTIKIPGWLEKFFSMIGNNALQMSQGMQFNPEPVNPNTISYGGNTNNTSNQFTINTNQPTDIVASNLINTFTPTQVQLSSMAV